VSNYFQSSASGNTIQGNLTVNGTFNVNGTKSFIIDHPTNTNKYLVHACLEGPEAGVYYRGKAVIENDESIEIILPDYADKIATDFTPHITPLCKNFYYSSEIENNRFTVYGLNGKFSWIVYGKRVDIEVEPDKSEVNVKGIGPYKWI